ncbi:molecular chaperone HscA [Stella humosa]|uniref:Chaperone protein HscA homolog n=1 Tax=Stella humosa TaxID=94 RepID=A0A3N1MCS9_9PROT|nr:Fe-S protein assembly chaperone HscA [Stella humosa]ROQ01099.1 molecular chaperone HscA [Stella humosa]BBK31471.1 chaperone protein HscA [Stella humosa]
MMLLQIHEPGETPLPHEERGVAVGIDLGTTNSVVAVATDGRPQVLRDADGRGLVPSVVAYADGAPPLVGEAARRRLLDEPDQVVSSIKRLMGRGAGEGKALAGTLPYRIAEPAPGEGGMVRLLVGTRRLSPVEISADILGALKARAEAALGRSVERAVVTVPAYFDDAARTATRDAARIAGLEVLRLVNEPTAAALAYGLDQGAEGLYAVYDLGGGTFDLSILRLEKGVFQVLATGGDAALGGDDFDHTVAEHFLAQSAATRPTESEAKLALATARLAKECLTTQDSGDWRIELAGQMRQVTLDRGTLDRLIAPLVDRTVAICREVMAEAAIEPASIQGVVLVGGSTRVPLVRARVEALFGRPPLADIDPDEVVALGAALQAEALTVGSDTLLLDVTPLSLGIETMGGIVEKVIQRNTPIPVSRGQEFTTYQDGQGGMLFHVVQGERETVDECRSLARFELRGIPAMTAGAARVLVTFAVDADGLLTVSAEEKTTGVRQAVEVKPSYGLADEELIQMLRDGMEHGARDMARRLLIEARVEARRVLLALAAARAADADLLPAEEATAVDDQVARLESLLQADDRDAINSAVEELERRSQPFAQRRMDKAIRLALAGRSIDEVSAATAGTRN